MNNDAWFVSWAVVGVCCAVLIMGLLAFLVKTAISWEACDEYGEEFNVKTKYIMTMGCYEYQYDFGWEKVE